MFSLELPYYEYNFTSQIVDAQKEGRLNEFKKEWDMPYELELLLKQCMNNSPCNRPDFDSIMITLLKIAQDMPFLSNICTKLQKKYGHKRLKHSMELRKEQQLKSLDTKLNKLNQKEVSMDMKLKKLECELLNVRKSINETEKSKESITSDIGILQSRQNSM